MLSPRLLCATAAFLSLPILTPALAPARAAVLYSGGALPSAEGWVTQLTPGMTQTKLLSTSGVRLDSTANSALQGGFAYDTPTGLLSAATGFTLSFTSALRSESHDSPNRSGFSAILVTDSLQAVEFDFRSDEIYTQSLAFTPAETVSFDPSAITTYDVTVSGSAYTLSSAGNVLLTGPLRPLSTGDNANAFYYANPGSLFFGDDTQGASATSDLFKVTVVPEAQSTALLPLLALTLRRRR